MKSSFKLPQNAGWWLSKSLQKLQHNDLHPPYLLCCIHASKDLCDPECVLPGALLPVHGHCTLPLLGLTEVPLSLMPCTFGLKSLCRKSSTA